MGKLKIEQTAELNVSASKAWEIVGPNFVQVSAWGRGILESWNNESLKTKIENAPAGGRFCKVIGFGEVDEQILHYDDKKLEITWSAKSPKFPGFLSGVTNEVKVTQKDDNSCVVSSNISADVSGVAGFFLVFPLKLNFTKVMKGFISDWKSYAETGQVSPVKQKELIKHKSKK
jgi:hypothetical protein